MDADAAIEVGVSKDGLEALVARGTPAAGAGRPLVAEGVLEAMRRSGIVAEPEAEAVREVVDRLAARQDVHGIVVARGTPAADGEDGRVELLFETERSIGEEVGGGRIDWHERGAIQTVKAGDPIARIHPPGPGSPGRDVLGRPIPPREGRSVTLNAGKNVDVSEDGFEYRARIDGLVTFTRGLLSVSDVIEHKGDVDMSSGNLRAEKGSIAITGTVRSGFAVSTPEDVRVGEAIEAATIEAGGDVHVGRGIVMKDGEGRIRAGGSVHARFAQNSRIEAGGDVLIDNDLTRCEVVAHGKVVATAGKGRILGGTIRASGGIEVKEIGSEAGTTTHIHVGLEGLSADAVLAEKDECLALVAKIDGAIGMGEPREILLRTAPERREAVVALLRKRQEAATRAEALDEELRRERERLANQAKARVKVLHTAHPGTWFHFGDSFLEVRRAIHASQIFYDVESKSVRWSPL